MTPGAPPPILFEGRRWSSEELAAMSNAWRNSLRVELGTSSGPVAMVLTNHPESVAVFFALSCFATPVIVLPPELRGWRSSTPLPAGTRAVFAPRLRGMTAEAEELGLRVTVLPEPDGRRSAGDASFMTAPGFVLFTSGSTDLPRPVYRPTTHLLGAASGLATAVGFPPHSGVIGALPLARGYGMIHGLMMATVLGRPLALLDHFDHNALLSLFASGAYHYWAGLPVTADLLSLSVGSASHPAPPICVFAGRLSVATARTFEARFGVRPRQVYGTTESGPVTLDAGPGTEVRSQTAGRPLPGAAVCIGDAPRAPFAPGTPGRIWVSSPWAMEGYGFPPDLEAGVTLDGWWPSPDIGELDDGGYLSLVGRADDCIRTATGHLVNPAEVAGVLEAYAGVLEAVVVPLDMPTGPVLGALVQSAQPQSSTKLREHLARSLPSWSQPRVVTITTENLPRLAGGRTDRRACIEILSRALVRGTDD